MSSTTAAPASMSPCSPSPESTSWQKPCVVAMVAASKSESARSSRARRCSTVAQVALREQAHDRVDVLVDARQRGGEPGLDGDEPLAHPLAQLARRHARERHEQQLLERRPLGDVPGRERGDRVGLARAGARLEHGHAARQRPADVERLGHRCVTCSQVSGPAQRRRA